MDNSDFKMLLVWTLFLLHWCRLNSWNFSYNLQSILAFHHCWNNPATEWNSLNKYAWYLYIRTCFVLFEPVRFVTSCHKFAFCQSWSMLRFEVIFNVAVIKEWRIAAREWKITNLHVQLQRDIIPYYHLDLGWLSQSWVNRWRKTAS